MLHWTTSHQRHLRIGRVTCSLAGGETTHHVPNVSRLFRSAAAAVGSFLTRIGFRWLPRSQWRGFELYSQVGVAGLAILEARVAPALDLIQATDPRQSASIARYLRRFGIVSRGGDHYLEPLRAHVVSQDWLEHLDYLGVALNIIHESTHARLRAMGIQPTRHNIERIEAICVAQEIRFARRLPEGIKIAHRREKTLGRKWWDPAKERSRAEARTFPRAVQRTARRRQARDPSHGR